MKILYIAPVALLLGGCIHPPLFGNPFKYNPEVGLLCANRPSESYPTRNCGEAREAVANPPSAPAPEKPSRPEPEPEKPGGGKPDRPDKPDKPHGHHGHDRDKPGHGHGHGDKNHDHDGPKGGKD